MVESKSDYRALKRNKGTVTIKVEEVLKPIFIKGLLSRREMQVVFAIIAHSWRWGNRQYTQRPVDLHELSKETGLNYANLTRIWRSLIERRVIRVDDRKRASFNEHHEDWKNLSQATVKTTTSAGKLSKRQLKVVKTTTKTVKTTTPTPLNRNGDKELQNPKITYKNNIKNNKRGAQKKRAPAHPHFQEFVGWWKQMWSSHNTNKAYVWTDLDGTHLKRLLGAIGIDDLQTRAAYAFENAGKPGPLSWFRPPFTFQEFASSKVINKCSEESEGSAGYADADAFIEQERQCEVTGSHSIGTIRPRGGFEQRRYARRCS